MDEKGEILSTVVASVTELLTLPEFESWRSAQTWASGDLCVLNSSFLLRDGVRTNQSQLRLVLRSDSSGRLVLSGAIEIEKMRSPFKRFAASSLNIPTIQPLDTAIRDEVANLGDVLFTLIGDLAPEAAGTVASNGLPGVQRVDLDTSLATPAKVVGDVIVVSNTYDEESIWNAVHSHFDDKDRPILAKLLEELEDEASRTVIVPRPGESPKIPLLRDLCSGLETQALEYQEALDTWSKSAHQDEGALHQILRISYNFAADAVRLIRLTISVCDLKPVVYWCTINHHLALDTAIKGLPWQTHSKASLEAYTKIVNSARNHAFHDLFPVISGLNVELPDAALRKVRLRLFSRFGSRKNRNEVRFEDQELVELLTEFTRAGRRVTPPTFWEQNLMTMEAALELLEATTKSLIILRKNSL